MQYKEDSCEAAAAEPKHKERKIVTWTQEEDDILREQISIHGTDNWIIIASKFKDKTTRQCRRRWYTYLNSDFKKGGWSPEEDLLLCEAQKIFGNKWTEIAKVVSGRTDNAVKNRFTTLCKKKAKREVLAKENSASYIHHNKKRIVVQLNGLHSEGALDIAGPLKKMRYHGAVFISIPFPQEMFASLSAQFHCFRRTHITNPIESCNYEDKNSNYCRATKQQPRLPFAVLAQKDHNVNNLLPQHIGTAKEALLDGNKKIEGTFLKKDDPKIIALVQQAQLLSSLALKVNSDNTEQSLENAWEIVQNFSNKSKETGEHLQHNEIKDLVEELKSGYHASQPSQRLPDIYESPSSSEYSTGSTSVCNTASEHQTEQSKVNNYMVDEDMGTGLHLIPRGDKNAVSMADDNLPTGTSENLVEIIAAGAAENDGGVVSTLPALEFRSPPQVTPLFGSLAATIPSPQFSESERHFLMKTLGIESPIPNTTMNPSQPPPCRRALVHSL